MPDVDLALILRDGEYLKRVGDELAGDVGLVGPQGEPGPAGPKGDQGDQGEGVHVVGVLAGAATPMPTPPVPGDLYVLGTPIPTAAPPRSDGAPAEVGDGVVWAGDEWVNTGPVQGPAAPAATRAQALAGVDDDVTMSPLRVREVLIPLTSAMPLILNQPNADLVTRDPGNPIWERVAVGDSVLGSLYWPWAIRVGHLPIDPLDEWYLYVSSDHNGLMGNQDGGIELTSFGGFNDDRSIMPITSHGFCYQDIGAADSIETMSVLWDEQTNKMLGFHQRYDAHTGGGQASCLTESLDGRTGWEPYTVVLDAPIGWRAAVGPHTGYMRPWHMGNDWGAYSLASSGGRNLISYSADGRKWFSHPRVLPRTNANGGTAWIQTTPIRWQGETWAITNMGAAGLGMTRLAPDFRSVVGLPILLMTATGWEINTGGSAQAFRSVFAAAVDGVLHIFYKAGGTTEHNGAIGHAWLEPGELG